MAATAEQRVSASAHSRTAAPVEPVALSAALSRPVTSGSVAAAAVALQRLRSLQVSLSSRWLVLRDEPVRRGDVAARDQRRLRGRVLRGPGGSGGRLSLQSRRSLWVPGCELRIRRLLRRFGRLSVLLPRRVPPWL